MARSSSLATLAHALARAGQRVLLFEANATMSFYTIAEEPPFGYFGPMVERASRAVDAMLAG